MSRMLRDAIFQGRGRRGRGRPRPRRDRRPESGGPAAPAGPRAVSSGNGLRATEKAMEILKAGGDPLDAVIAGVNIVEDDPNDMSVGYGGAAQRGRRRRARRLRHVRARRTGPGPWPRCANIKNPSKVARLVMERSDHVLLVGEGALKFARAHGFKEEDLLTERSREAWLRWKETMSGRRQLVPASGRRPGRATCARSCRTHGTINCLAIDGAGAPGRRDHDERPVLEAGRTGRGLADHRRGALRRQRDRRGRLDGPGRGQPPDVRQLPHRRRHGAGAVARTGLPRGLPGRGRQDQARAPALRRQRAGRSSVSTFYALNTQRGVRRGRASSQGGRYAVHDGAANELREVAYLYKDPGDGR
ncbi:MAG: isoaspartyl peptidase/L-asparaginase [Chromatiales bacterium]|nr:isoaspartyl peptidase/L-asparaginase [Chromatiales bacterium]